MIVTFLASTIEHGTVAYKLDIQFAKPFWLGFRNQDSRYACVHALAQTSVFVSSIVKYYIRPW